MAEMKIRNVLMVGCVVVVIGVVALAASGFIAIGWLNKKTLTDLADQGLATATGYGPAKTPVEAMDYFYKAIQDRNYKAAANYTTKEYGEQLKRAHDGASALGRHTDSIRSFANDKQFLNDRLTYAMSKLDPFPRNFKPGPAPVVAGDKATGTFVWDPVKYETQNPLALAADPNFKDFDPRMFDNLLRQPFGIITQVTPVGFVKEGEEWKLYVPSNPGFENNVTYFMERQKAYNTALNGFVTDMNRLRNVTKAEFEGEVYKVIRESK